MTAHPVVRRILMRLLPLLAALALPAAAAAQDAPVTPDGIRALDLLVRGIGFKTFKGAGQVPAYAAYLRERLVEGGFAADDVAFTPLGETGYMTARYPGRDRAAKPMVVLAHMDVVTADPADWTRDPFTAVVEKGYVFGRGALDNKADLSIVVATLLKLKREGFTPKRDIVLLLTGDEETEMRTTAAGAEALGHADLVLNADGGGGLLGDEGGKPQIYGLQAAEKVYGDFRLTATDPGGHSSRPTATNAIVRLMNAAGRIAAYRFPAQINDVTRGFLRANAATAPAPLAAAMRAFVASPKDGRAAEALSRSPDYVGQVRTTCVVTQIAGGHAPNALPQSATANVNCRIFPGTSRAAIQAKLTELVADPGVKVEFRPNGTLEAGASPLQPAVTAAVAKAVAARAPGVPIAPEMSAGATDSMHFRARGIPAYGVGSVFIRGADVFAHGLNERLPVATIDPGVAHWESLLRTLG
jgi:acetylornithine deacetylase/succinyl-diaminopimelate desuccinylase-like protein